MLLRRMTGPCPTTTIRPVAASLAALLAVLVGEAAAQNGWLPTTWFSSETAIDSDAMFPLSERDGPWLVLASTFRGEGARDDARRLVQELRGTHKLEAFTHVKSFDYTGKPQGLGLNPDGSPKKMRYANASQVTEVAVLVGNFASVDDPRGQKMLAKIKSLEPRALSGSGGQSRAFSDFKRSMGLAASGKGPMKLAFMIPNPLLPEEFFSQNQVDTFVLEMNSDVEHSLLDCPGRYSVRVAVFTGSGTLDQKAIEAGPEDVPLESRLVQAAEKAHRLTESLRRSGHQAWEYHDRESSIVCVGSFAQVKGTGADGRPAVHPDVQQVIAAFGPDPAQMAKGMIVPRSIDGIMLEIEPKPIEVPRLARAPATAGGRRMMQR